MVSGLIRISVVIGADTSNDLEHAMVRAVAGARQQLGSLYRDGELAYVGEMNAVVHENGEQHGTEEG